MLGPLEVYAGDRPLRLTAAKPRSALAFLLLHANTVVSTDRLIEALWGERPPPTASNALQGYVSRLRRLLAQGSGASLETRAPGYVLSLAPAQLDVNRFRALVKAGRERVGAGDAIAGAAQLDEALALFRGRPLAEFAYESWTQTEVTRLEEERLEAIEERLEAELACGHHASVVGELEVLVEQQPLRERPRAQLILALYRSGRQAEALDAYQQARRTFIDELGIEPSPELQDLHRRVLNQDPSLALSRPETHHERPTNLPLPPNPLIGRDDELAELRALLGAEHVRLVTVTGPGGSGKTRLALEAAAEPLDAYPDGVFFVSLAPIADVDIALAEIGRGGGAHSDGAADAASALAAALAGRDLLVVADNLEQLPIGTAIADVLERAPGFKLLATSRTPLRVRAEHRYPLGPLALPQPGEETDVAVLARSPAVTLFAGRARAVDPAFALSAGNAAAVAEICRRLDGLPLAIELAAARLDVLPPALLAEQLGHALRVLASGPLDLPERQQALRATIAWSYDLLRPDEQVHFARLGVFAAGFETAGAEAVALDARSSLASLVEASLVIRDEGGRFAMLETIREYALERLAESREEDEVRLAHLSYLGEVAGAADAELNGPRQAEALAALAREHDDFRSALVWCLEARPEDALRLATTLQRFWYLRGYTVEGLRWLEAALARATGVPLLLRARALRAAGTLAHSHGDYARSWELLEASVDALRTLDEPKELAISLNNLAGVALQRGDYETSSRLFDESLEIKRRLGDVLGVANTSGNLGILAVKRGLFDEGRALHEEALTIFRRLTHASGISNSLASVGELELLRGDVAAARAALSEALELRRQIGDRAGISEALVLLARTSCAEGEREDARRLAEEALELSMEIEDRAGLVGVLEVVAATAAEEDAIRPALLLQGAAEALRAELGSPLWESDRQWRERTLARAGARSDVEEIGRTLEEGRRLPLDRVLALAAGGAGARAQTALA